MRKPYLQFGCFLTGYKYSLLKHCSAASEKALIKYTSALLLVCLIWGFVGFTFTQHYLHSRLIGSICGAIVLVFAVVQIERQIILTMGKHWRVALFRIIIGFVIAIIGSIIIDQILFKEDINIQKEKNIRAKVITDIDLQIEALTNEISVKEKTLDTIFAKFKREPTVPGVVGIGESNYARDTTGKMVLIGRKYTSPQPVQNPIAQNIPLIQSVIDTLRKKQFELSNLKTEIIAGNGINEDIKKETKHGFLDELSVMKSILFTHTEALFVWGLFFIFFLSIELFILFNKFYDKDNDYEHLVLHQMNIRIEQLKALHIDQPYQQV